MDLGGRAKQEARAEDERSAFWFQTKAKYLHPCRHRFLSSRLKLSTYIHVGNVTVSWMCKRDDIACDINQRV